ncbi:MAG: nitroreductase family protein [Candidatus Cloacimonetes bacterium]|nr:nitroreductase family protein [Candidatus Cloacimonadota bacterium]
MEFNDLLMTRKSVRSYLSEPIPDDVLQGILEAGRNAPSFQNKQCWRFVVINNREEIKRFSSNIGLIGKVNFFIKDAPIIIVGCADPAKSGTVNKQSYYLVDTTIAFQQMMLAAWNYGIGSCWMAAFDEDKVKKFLSIPKNIRVVAISPFGYPKAKESIYGKVIKLFASSNFRQKIDEMVCYNKWTFE